MEGSGGEARVKVSIKNARAQDRDFQWQLLTSGDGARFTSVDTCPDRNNNIAGGVLIGQHFTVTVIHL